MRQFDEEVSFCSSHKTLPWPLSRMAAKHTQRPVGGARAAIYHRRRINICCHLWQLSIQDMKLRCYAVPWVRTNPTSNSVGKKKTSLGRSSRLRLTCQWGDAWVRLVRHTSVITVPKEVEMSSCSCASIKSELGGWSSFDHSVNSLLFSLVLTCTHLSIYYHSQVTATVRTETWTSDCWHQMNHPASWKNMLAFPQYWFNP